VMSTSHHPTQVMFMLLCGTNIIELLFQWVLTVALLLLEWQRTMDRKVYLLSCDIKDMLDMLARVHKKVMSGCPTVEVEDKCLHFLSSVFPLKSVEEVTYFESKLLSDPSI
jgi:hypothetical protein